jgi:Fur family peroxide stress response transcriptional regulator
MDASEKQHRLEVFEQLCQERGIPCTIQRRVILQAVLDRDDHPSANEVFEDVKSLHRGISRATVHRTLETLTGLGVITKTCHPGNVARYDPRVEIHHHLVCMKCYKVIDIHDEHLDSLRIPDTSAFGFEVTDFRVQLRGTCRECRGKKSSGVSAEQREATKCNG